MSWSCEPCVFYPPSSCDGKPCSQCTIDKYEKEIPSCYRGKEDFQLYSESEAKHIFAADKPKTNADRIRAMTDEELVKQFAVEMGFCCPVKGVDCSLEPDCRVCFARWLKQEAADKDGA